MALLFDTPLTRLKKARRLYGHQVQKAIRTSFLATARAHLRDGRSVRIEQVDPDGHLIFADPERSHILTPIDPDDFVGVSYA